MNLLGKLFYVYWVIDPNGEDDDDEIVISQSHQDYLGHSQLLGIFRWQRLAEAFASVQERKLQRGKLNWSEVGRRAA